MIRQGGGRASLEPEHGMDAPPDRWRTWLASSLVVAVGGVLVVLAANVATMAVSGDRYLDPQANPMIITLASGIAAVLIGMWLARHVMHVWRTGRSWLGLAWLTGFVAFWIVGVSMRPVSAVELLAGWLAIGLLFGLRVEVTRRG